jgi:hypothetical protein
LMFVKAGEGGFARVVASTPRIVGAIEATS